MQFPILLGDFNFKTILYAIYESLEVHGLFPNTDFSHNPEHKLYMIKVIADKYIHIRATYLAKLATLDAHPDGNKRQILHKLIHHRNQ